MINKKIITGIIIILVLLLTGFIVGTVTSNLTQKAAKPASASGTYIQNTTTVEEESDCCTN